jgi:hypothetical protein
MNDAIEKRAKGVIKEALIVLARAQNIQNKFL